jgi:hypothetical protein
MREFPDNCIDSIITDPPYDLTGKSGNGGFMGKKWDSSGIAFNPEVWREALRVAKPGATLMAFGGSRTYHRLTCAIEDAGWEIRDCISYFHDGTQQERAFMASLSEEQLGAYLELHRPGAAMGWVFGCLSEDTEILTTDGFKRYHRDIVSSDVLCYNIDSKSFEWERPTNVYEYKYADTAYRIKSDFTDQIVSRNHRCIVDRKGTLLFEFAEYLQAKEKIPTLENLQELLYAFYDFNEKPTKKCDLQSGVCNSKDKSNSPETVADEQTENDLGQMCKSRMWQRILQGKCLDQKERSIPLQQTLQRENTRRGVEGTCPQGPGGVVRGNEGTLSAITNGREQSGLEGRCHVSQESGELWQSDHKIREVSKEVSEYGETGRVRNGTSFVSGPSDRQAIDKIGGCASYEPRCGRQQPEQPNVIQEQQGSQAVRKSRFTRTDLATITPIHYKGIMWCVEVPSGAFVARRNGKIFITGNSGFPKSTDISKQLNKAAIVDCQYCNGSGKGRPSYMIFCPEHGEIMGDNDLCPVCDSEVEEVELERDPCKYCGGNGKVKGAEREVIGTKFYGPDGKERTGGRLNGNYSSSDYGEFNSIPTITSPTTPLATKFNGYGTALKPAHEPIVVAMKPIDGTFAANAEKWGVSGLNIDRGRVGTEDDLNPNDYDDRKRTAPKFSGKYNNGKTGQYRNGSGIVPPGRWPANVILGITGDRYRLKDDVTAQQKAELKQWLIDNT